MTVVSLEGDYARLATGGFVHRAHLADLTAEIEANVRRALGPVDVNALLAPGSEVKDALIPLNALSASIGVTDALTVEATRAVFDDSVEIDPPPPPAEAPAAADGPQLRSRAAGRT